MLVDEIKKSILAAGFRNGDKMPSVRKMSEQLGLSVATVHKAYKELAEEGVIKMVQGKGCFWGAVPVTEVVRSESVYEHLEKLFQSDLENGYLNAFDYLPAVKELAVRYKVSPYIIKIFLSGKVAQGVLHQAGRKFFFNAEQSVQKGHFILFVHRSDESGRLIIESERESSVFRALVQAASEQKIGVHFVGYHEKTDKLFTAEGTPFTTKENRYCLGVFISTWLVKNAAKLFSHFALFQSPISVWWEYDPTKVPSSVCNKKKWAFYNVAFGKESGNIVGRHLLAKGIQKVYYVSPFHGSFWSRARLQGLQESGVTTIPLVNGVLESPFDLMNEADRKGVSHQELMDGVMAVLLGAVSDEACQCFVCVNDWVAVSLITYFEKRKKKRPYVLGFDDSIDSYRYVFDSFAFNAGAMIKEALYHIVAPTIYAERKRQMQTPLGRVVEKE